MSYVKENIKIIGIIVVLLNILLGVEVVMGLIGLVAILSIPSEQTETRFFEYEKELAIAVLFLYSINLIWLLFVILT